ncbi:MAG: hypothetical protein M3430_10240 [Acidobacteriota bacterium]|nr:hypothetical protein [Acidobacteriota bacterium]
MKLASSLIVALLLLFPVIASAQTRGRRSTTQRRRTPAASSSTAARRASEELAAGRTRVAQQIKDLTRFIYLYGRITKDLESSEAQARGSGAASQAAALSNQTRTKLRSSLQNVREGLDQLEIYFRTTPALQRYYIRLAGVAAGAAGAEDRVAANQLDQAGRLLVDVAGRLTDVLSQMTDARS